MDLHSRIASFLELGYFIDYPVKTVQLPSRIDSTNTEGLTNEKLFITVRQKLLKSFDKGYSPGQYCVVPLSGGLDSRAVLGGLLQFTEASNIVTYTYGIPGSFDYEIAAQVARKVGVSNIRVSLDKYQHTLEELIETSIKMDHQTLLFYHAPLRFVEREFSGGVHWSGFLGEAITGDHLRGELARSLKEAESKFFDLNRFVKGRDAEMLERGYEYGLQHLATPDSSQGFLTYEEGFDILNRQNKYVAPHVMPKGFDHFSPFNDPDVISTFLGLDEQQKRQQAFFKSFLKWWKPQLFNLPVKNNMGLPLGTAPWRIKWKKKMLGARKRLGAQNDPNINYFNFPRKIIEDEYYKNLVGSQLDDLQGRKIMPEEISPKVLWNEHQCRTADHGAIIQGLVSLEIHLKSGKQL